MKHAFCAIFIFQTRSRVKLIFQDGSDVTQQKGGFTSKKAAEQARTEIIGQLYSSTYVVYDNVAMEDFLEGWKILCVLK